MALRLEEQGHEVHFAVPGSPDEAVLALAARLRAVLLTEDTDFGELTTSRGAPHCGVLLLRMPGASLDAKLEAVNAALPALQDGRFVVSKFDKQRSR